MGNESRVGKHYPDVGDSLPGSMDGQLGFDEP